MDETAMRIIRQELDADEHLVWAGRPRQGVVLTHPDWFLVPFSLLWGGFAIVWEINALASGVWPMAVFGAFFVAAGLHFMVGRFFMAARKRGRTYYGISDRRVIIVKGKRFERVQSKDLASIDELDLTVRDDGSGTIELGREGGFPAAYTGTMADAGWPMAERHASARLALIDNVRDVYEILRKTSREQDRQTKPQ